MEWQEERGDAEAGKHQAARTLAERAVRAQAAGDEETADRLFAEAARLDPSAVEAVLSEAVAPLGAPAEPQDDTEIAAMSRTVEPGDAPSRAGIGGRGSGADGQGL